MKLPLGKPRGQRAQEESSGSGEGPAGSPGEEWGGKLKPVRSPVDWDRKQGLSRDTAGELGKERTWSLESDLGKRKGAGTY